VARFSQRYMARFSQRYMARFSQRYMARSVAGATLAIMSDSQ